MKIFQCQCCGQILHFENTICLRCGHQLGYLPAEDRMIAVGAEGAVWRALPVSCAGANGGAPIAETRALRFCRNWELSACNWLVPVDPDFDPAASDLAAPSPFCPACVHNRMVPDLSDPEQMALWHKIESAKRRLIYSILHLGLPRPAVGSGHHEPLVFDFLADDPGSVERVLTGHADGVVTIALVEADDAAREKRRSDMGEAYRTLLGHFRHEVGHYYWDILVRDGGALDGFRRLFGDERHDYGDALQRHYANGAPLGWEAEYVSAYATMHPWEDWAETWAHYLHMVDTLETGAALGLRVDPGLDATGDLSAELDFNPYRPMDAADLIAAWVPLTLTLNLLNRSMGQGDSYPFTIPEPVARKLSFVHELVSQAREPAPKGA